MERIKKYLNITSFMYRTGSVFLRSFKIYKIDFNKLELSSYIEKNNEIISLKTINLTNEKKEKFINEIYDFKYFEFNERYINRRFHDGNQWSLEIMTEDDKFVSSGSNAYPENYYLIRDFINELDSLLDK